MIYDLTGKLLTLDSKSVLDRMDEAAVKLPDVGVVALNGIPFIGSDPVSYFGHPVTEETIHQQMRLALGFGGVLTHTNVGQRTLYELSDISLEHGHDWALHAVNVTVCFAGCPTFVEMSFSRDGRFHLSWVEPRARTDWNSSRVFTATAPMKHWKKYLKNRNSPDFLKTQREWLTKTHQVLRGIFPDYLDAPR